MRRKIRLAAPETVAGVLAILLLMLGCQPATTEVRIIYVTATPGSGAVSLPVAPSVSEAAPVTLSPLAEEPAAQPSAPVQESSQAVAGEAEPRQIVVQPGDTLTGIGQFYNVSVETILALNEMTDPDLLYVGQVIQLPALPVQQSPDTLLIPDSRLVRGPGSTAFDIAAFIDSYPGILKTITDPVETRQADGEVEREVLSAAQIVSRVALEFSVDPRLLLALLEFRAGWLSRPDLGDADLGHPMIAREDSEGIDRSGLYRQLAWTANMLNFGYYGWLERGWSTLEFEDGTQITLAEGLNAGTVSVLYMLSRFTPYSQWLSDVSDQGFSALYRRLFGDPFAEAGAVLVPPDLTQPDMMLPFGAGEVWFFTGGAHGGWGAGSAWAAVDFAPPDLPPAGISCYTSTYWVTAVAPGVIARSGAGVVVLDLDGDGDETTGWTVLYLHIADDGRVQEGSRVTTGDPLGHAACQGGFSTATHMHIARRYNGEWIPADCPQCRPEYRRPAFVMGGWSVVTLPSQEYQGFLERNGERRTAEQGRLTPENRVSW
jgi:LysM repeat protein